MYIDSFTVTALVVFIVMLAVFVRFCMVKVCGMAAMHRHDNRDRQGGAQGGDKS
jgi:hypothetical protein